MESERNILDHIYILVRWRRLILTSFILVSLTTAGISLILPIAYRARATVYPPQDSSGGLGLSSLLQELPINLMGIGGDAVTATEFVPVIESEQVRLAVAERFDLANRYGASHRSELLDMVSNRLQVELSREQFLSISYEADTPQLAAEITNAFVEELQHALAKRTQSKTKAYLTYLENRLEEAENDMLQAEKKYNDFQKQHMVIDLETQAKVQLESTANLVGALTELILKRDIQAEMMSPDHPELKKLDLEIQTTRRTLDNLLMGKLPDPDGSTAQQQLPDIFKPFHDLPQLGLNALQLIRDVQIQNAIYQFVKQEYEKTRFEDEKGSKSVIILDTAHPPDVRSYPARSTMVIIAGGLSLVLSCLFAFVFEALGNLTPENRDKIKAISNTFKKNA